MNTRKLSVTTILLFLFVFVNFASAQWVEMPTGMYMHQAVFTLAVNGNTVFAGCGYNGNSGIYATTNNGTSWTQSGLTYDNVYALAVNGNIMYAGTSVTGAFVSTNSGADWSQTSLNNIFVISLAINGNHTFAGTPSGVYLSIDNGATWSQTTLNNRNTWSLFVSGSNILAGTQSYGVYLSSDNGATWPQTSLNNQDVQAFVESGNNVFAGTGAGVFKSTNNGITWVQTSLNNLAIRSLAAINNTIFAGTGSSGVYVSTDAGTSWIQRNEGLTGLQATSFCIANGYIFAGSSYYTVFRRPLSELTGINPISEQVPSHFSLSQNYPNPFNPSTKFRIEIAKLSDTRITVYDVLGKEVEVLVSQQLKPGVYEVEWDAGKYSSGVYFYKIISGDFAETKRMMLIK